MASHHDLIGQSNFYYAFLIFHYSFKNLIRNAKRIFQSFIWSSMRVNTYAHACHLVIKQKKTQWLGKSKNFSSFYIDERDPRMIHAVWISKFTLAVYIGFKARCFSFYLPPRFIFFRYVLLSSCVLSTKGKVIQHLILLKKESRTFIVMNTHHSMFLSRH